MLLTKNNFVNANRPIELSSYQVPSYCHYVTLSSNRTDSALRRESD